MSQDVSSIVKLNKLSIIHIRFQMLESFMDLATMASRPALISLDEGRTRGERE